MVIVAAPPVMSPPDGTAPSKLVIGEIIISIKSTDFPEEDPFVADTPAPLKLLSGYVYIILLRRRGDCNDVSRNSDQSFGGGGGDKEEYFQTSFRVESRVNPIWGGLLGRRTGPPNWWVLSEPNVFLTRHFARLVVLMGLFRDQRSHPDIAYIIHIFF